ncbi:hypothetical protein HKD37_04G010947 [Glycine soja]|nr:hypothetical protein GmHk_04G011057 [Glycine max]
MNSLKDLENCDTWNSITNKVSHAYTFSLLQNPYNHLIYHALNTIAFIKLHCFNVGFVDLNSLKDLNISHYCYETYLN